jgi:NAD(P)H-dependent FMN reductase
MIILALSGSLRAASENTRLLRALARLAPEGIEVIVYSGLGELPLFNPDSEFPNPSAVAALREAINAADAVVIASPEYAHGVSAVIKNALDWMVGNESFVNKPVALLNAAPRATHAYLALRETVTMMSANLIEAASITLAQPITGMGKDEIAQRYATELAEMLETISAVSQKEKMKWQPTKTP